MSEYDWFVAWWRDQWRPRWEKVPSEEIFRSTSDYARWIDAGNPGFTGTPQGFEATIRGEQTPQARKGTLREGSASSTGTARWEKPPPGTFDILGGLFPERGDLARFQDFVRRYYPNDWKSIAQDATFNPANGVFQAWIKLGKPNEFEKISPLSLPSVKFSGEKKEPPPPGFSANTGLLPESGRVVQPEGFIRPSGSSGVAGSPAGAPADTPPEEPTSPDDKWLGPPPPTGQQVAPGVFWDADKEKWLDAQGFELTESAAKVLIKRFTTPTAEDRLLKEQENIRRLQEKGNIFQEQQTALLGAYGSQQTSDVQLQQARFDAYEEARKQILQDATGPADWIVRFAAQNTPNPHRPEKLSDFESLTQSVQQATNKRGQAIKNSQRLFTEEMNALESGNEGLAKELQTKWEASNKAIQHFDKVLFTVNKELAKGPQENAEFFGAEERQVQTLPNLPNFLAQFTGGGAGQRIDEIGPIRTLSGKQLANLNPTTSGALTGLAEFQGGLSFPDRLAASVAQLPRDVSRGPQTTPFMQRGGIV